MKMNEIEKLERKAEIVSNITTHNKVGIYCRVSSQDQVREGHSLPEQEDRLRKLCAYKNYEIIDIYIIQHQNSHRIRQTLLGYYIRVAYHPYTGGYFTSKYGS